MAIYILGSDKLLALEQTSFSTQKIRERNDLQRLLRSQIEIISPDTLVVAEEFGEWEDSRRRIDLLGIDKDANVVVIELKRTEDGGHMELQAIRYAAMISTLTFGRVVDVYARFLESIGSEADAETALLEFLEWEEVEEDAFAQEVRIVLASAEFSKELTTSVIWLNTNGLNIRCVRLKPYSHEGSVLLNVQQVIPLPEAEEYQVNIRMKAQKEKEARSQSRDFTKFTVTTGGVISERLAKRRAILQIVKYLCDQGVSPEEIGALITWKKNSFRSLEGELSSAEFEVKMAAQMKAEGLIIRPRRYFIDDSELIYSNSRTYAFHKMWGTRTEEAMKILADNFKDKDISFQVST